MIIVKQITFIVKNFSYLFAANHYDKTATTASVTCVFLGLVIAAIVGVVVWLRHKAKYSRGRLIATTVTCSLLK